MALDTVVADLRLAARRLLQRPGFASIAILTLALGLGANIAIFTLVHATMLQTLPVSRPDELIRLGDDDNCCVNSGLQNTYSLFSYDAYLHLRDNIPQLASLAAFQANVQPVGIRRVGTVVTETLPTEYVSGNYFGTFGVRPAIGRLLDANDDRPGADPVFVVSYLAWSKRLAGDRSAVGASFLVAGKPMTLVGVGAEDFFGDAIRPDPASVWLPLGQEPYVRGAASLLERRDQDWLYAIGRLSDGATAAAVASRATTEIQRWLSSQSFLSDQLRKRIPQQRIIVTTAAGGVTVLRYAFERPLTLLFAMSALVLLIASANLANLLLARTDPGQVAIQTALGASVGRLVRQALCEGLLLAGFGAAAGMVVAALATRAAVSLTFAQAEFLPLDVRPGGAVLLFAVVLAIVTCAVFSAAPSWATARANVANALGQVGRFGEQRSFVPRQSLVVAQVALSAVLLATAGLLTASLNRLEQQPLGFRADDTLVAHVRPSAPVDDINRLAIYYDRLRESLRRIPGVQNVSYSLYSPMQGDNWSSGITIAGRTPDPHDNASWNRIGPGYFETLGTRVLRGRAIDERDRPSTPRVAVVNEAFVRRYFPTADPIGQRLGVGGPAHAGDFEIVGVSEDVKYTAAQQPTRPMIFFPATQVAPYDDETSRNVQRRSTLMSAIELQRSSSASGAIEPQLRQALAAIDPDLAVVRVVPMTTQVSQNFQINRLMARLTAAYGILALIVAALGLYGVTSYGVVRRQREIGVRMALGADRTRVLLDVVRGALTQTAIGLLVGLPAAALATATLASLLYGINPRDPAIFADAALVLVVSAALAAFIPARRAASIDPAHALRGD